MNRVMVGLLLLAALLTGHAQAEACFAGLPQVLQENFADSEPQPQDVVCKIWPARAQLALLAVAIPRADFGDYGEADLQLLVVDTRQNKVVQRRLERNLLDWDAITVSKVSFDTARYQVRGKRLAFGVRISRGNHSSVNPFGETSLNLYLPEGEELKPVLRALMVERSQAEWDGHCEGERTVRHLTVGIDDKVGADGFRDLLVKETQVYTRDAVKQDGCATVQKKTTRQAYRLTFGGDEYPVPGAIQTLQ